MKAWLDSFLTGNGHTDQQALEKLNELRAIPISCRILKATSIGDTLRNIKLRPNAPELEDVATRIQNEWIEACNREIESKKRKRTERADEKTKVQTVAANIEEPTVEPITKKLKTESSEPMEILTSLSQPPADVKAEAPSGEAKAFSGTTDSVPRNEIQEQFFEALGVCDVNINGAISSEKLAVDIEKALFDRYQGVNHEYAASFRTLHSNLKDPLNLGLRHVLFSGALVPERFIKMTYEELANPEKRKERETIARYYSESRRNDAKRQASTSSMYTCHKCNLNRTTSVQLQTRSSDEPMTTFVTCVNCGHHWKM